MGLDTVEFIMRVEEAFDLSIPNEDAAAITTPRELVDYLMGRPELDSKLSRGAVAESVWQILEGELGIKRAKFREDSRFVQDMGMD
jgi:hypothetical protein